MDKHPEHTADFELIAAYLSGELDESDRQRLEDWINASDENRAFFEEMKTLFEEASPREGSGKPNVELAWSRVKAQIDTPVVSIQPKRRFWIPASIAAAVVLLISTWFALREKPPKVEMITFKSESGVSEIWLPDSTLVSLNEGSTITYPSLFTGNQRNVKMEGEGFFDVTHDPEHPFTIAVGQTEVKVLGTSFQVLETAEDVQVKVETGRVQFALGADGIETNSGLILTPGMRGTYDHKAGTFRSIEEQGQNYLYWKTGRLEYINTALQDVVQELEKYYGINIQFDDSALSECQLTTVFDHADEAAVIEVLEATFEFEILHEADTYIFKGEGCQ